MGLIGGLVKGASDLTQGVADVAKSAAEAVEAKKDDIRENSLEKSRQKDEGWAYRLELNDRVTLHRGERTEVCDRDGNLVYVVKASKTTPSRKLVLYDASGNKVMSLSLSLIKGLGNEGAVDAFPLGRVVKHKKTITGLTDDYYRLEGTDLWMDWFGSRFYKQSVAPAGYSDPIAIVHDSGFFEDTFTRINYNEEGIGLPLLVLYLSGRIISHEIASK